MKIYYKRIKDVNPPEMINNGDWIDLYTPKSISIVIRDGELYNVPLGIAMKVPDGLECILAFRSSSSKKYNLIPANGIGIIDNTYCGEGDEWRMPVFAIADTEVPANVRICQFKVQLSQKATFWQKVKWLFSNKLKLVEVEHLSDINRGGFGTTGS